MEIQTSVTRQKIIDSIQKSSELLAQGKAYEFAQKIKSLAQRKMQTNKPQQAEWLFFLGSEKLLQEQNPQINDVNELITSLLELYQKERKLILKDTSKELYRLLNIKPNPRRIEFYSTILKSISPINDSIEIVEDLISYYSANKQFWKVESLVVHLNLSKVTAFLQNWKNQVEEQESFIIYCRMALLKGIYYDFDQSMVILAELPGYTPFVKFSKFLIQSVQLKSKECYQKIGTSYAAFLKSDSFFDHIYTSYGVKYFKKEKKQAQGLQSLFSSLQ